jgi:hypothetical protein
MGTVSVQADLATVLVVAARVPRQSHALMVPLQTALLVD